jgi:hypothetical protein
MQKSIHDNHLLRYEVDQQNRTITLVTESSDTENSTLVAVVFSNVTAYSFASDSFELGTILFGIEEIPAHSIVDDDADMFETGRKYGWPGHWNRSLQEAKQHLRSEQFKGFEISSSIGLFGWIIAESVQLVEKDTAG